LALKFWNAHHQLIYFSQVSSKHEEHYTPTIKKSMSIWEKQDPTLVCCNYISLIRIKDVPPMFRGWNFYFKKKTIFNLGSKKNVNIKKIKYLTLSKDKMFRHIKKIIVYKLHFRFFLTHESYFWIMDIRPSSKVLYTLIIHMNLYFSNWCKKLG
jgi:hypothetical protein